MIKLVFFGDSICYGQFIPPNKIWMNRLSETLTAVVPEIYIQNSSVSGNTTRMALERMPHDVQAHGADVFYVQFGMNDCNYWATDNGMPRVSAAAFEANLHEILARGRRFGAKTLLLATNHPTPKTERYTYADISYQESNSAYNAIIRKVAQAEKTILVDHESYWFRHMKGSGVRDYVLEDGVHLNLEGHGLYYAHLEPILLQAVEFPSRKSA